MGNKNSRRVLVAFWAWQYGSFPYWASDEEMFQGFSDLDFMRIEYQKGGRWSDGWIAAHNAMLDKVYGESHATQN